MNGFAIAMGCVLALVAALRSTWSPCGQSMLAQITPIGERGRNNRFWLTSGWFVLGALAGGLTLGGVVTLLAAGVRALDPSTATAAGVLAVLALAGGALDLHLFRVGPPYFRRQVNEEWLGRYRSWVYGLGFGWQIGAGVTTYVMTTAVLVMVAAGALGASPGAALAVCGLFGLARGLAVLLGARVTTPAALAAFHLRFDRWGPRVRQFASVAQLLVAVAAAGVAWGVAGAVIGGAVVLALLAAGSVAPWVAQQELELPADAFLHSRGDHLLQELGR